MITAVLCGGAGTRLLGLNEDTKQKCCVEVAGKPFLQWRIEQLIACGYNDLHFITKGRYAAEVKMVVGDYPVHIEDISGDKFQAVAYAAELGKGKTVCVVNGDTWINLPPWYDLLGTPTMVVCPPGNQKPNICLPGSGPIPKYLDAGIYFMKNDWPQLWQHMFINDTPYHLNTEEDKDELDAVLRRHSESE